MTVDTEFLRESTYYPLLCVAQMASTDEAVVIDALAPGIDLSPFYALMANEKVMKVFHAARQDIEIVCNMAESSLANMNFAMAGSVLSGNIITLGGNTLKELNIKEARVSVQSRVTSGAIPQHAMFINLTALNNGHIIRASTHYTEVVVNFAEDRTKQKDATWAFVDKLRDEIFKEAGIELKPGEWIPG